VFEMPVQDRQAMSRPPSRSSAAAQPDDDDSGSVVLEATRRGREELERPRFGLGGNQRRLLAQLDGSRSIEECARAESRLQRPRLARDAARLVAFGLARQVRGELPQELLVAAMNLTARIPLDQLPPLEPERTVIPMAPRVAPSPASRAQPREEAVPTGGGRRWPIALLIVLLAVAVVAIGYLA
jgi:hypothetical protein